MKNCNSEKSQIFSEVILKQFFTTVLSYIDFSHFKLDKF